MEGQVICTWSYSQKVAKAVSEYMSVRLQGLSTSSSVSLRLGCWFQAKAIFQRKCLFITFHFFKNFLVVGAVSLVVKESMSKYTLTSPFENKIKEEKYGHLPAARPKSGHAGLYTPLL